MRTADQHFSVDGKGRIHEASVAQSVARLREMFPDIDTSAMEAQVMLERTHRLLATLRDAHWAAWGLTGSRYILLRLLYTAPEKRLMMSEIAAHMNLGPNSVTQLVDAMARSGLVERQAGDGDKRVIYATLTDEGADLFARVMPQTAGRIEQAFAPLTSNEREVLRHLLAKIRMHLMTNEALLEEDHPSDGRQSRRPADAP